MGIEDIELKKRLAKRATKSHVEAAKKYARIVRPSPELEEKKRRKKKRKAKAAEAISPVLPTPFLTADVLTGLERTADYVAPPAGPAPWFPGMPEALRPAAEPAVIGQQPYARPPAFPVGIVGPTTFGAPPTQPVTAGAEVTGLRGPTTLGAPPPFPEITRPGVPETGMPQAGLPAGEGMRYLATPTGLVAIGPEGVATGPAGQVLTQRTGPVGPEGTFRLTTQEGQEFEVSLGAFTQAAGLTGQALVESVIQGRDLRPQILHDEMGMALQPLWDDFGATTLSEFMDNIFYERIGNVWVRKDPVTGTFGGGGFGAGGGRGFRYPRYGGGGARGQSPARHRLINWRIKVTG